MFRLLGQGVGRLQKGDEDAVFQGDGRPGGFGARIHAVIIVVITIIVKRKTPASLYLHLGFPQRPKVNLTPEASRALRDDGFHGVSDVFGRQRLRSVLRAARGEFRGDASRADHADADAVLAEIFRHAAGKPDDAPLGSTIDSAASEGIFSGQRADVDDVARAAADHGRRHGAGNEKDALEIGVQHAIPIGFGSLMGWAEQADARVVDEDGDGPQLGFRFGYKISNVPRFGNVGHLRMNGDTKFRHVERGFLERGYVPAANRAGGSLRRKLAGDGPAHRAASAGDERHGVRQRFLFARVLIWFACPNHQNSSSYAGHSFCATLILSLEFSAILGSHLVALRETTGGVFFNENFPQVIKSANGNVLQIRCGFPYNPKVFRNNAIPGRSIPGCTGSRNSSSEWSEETWE